MASDGWFDRAKVHVAMTLVGAGYGGYYVLTKTSLSGGIDPFVFSTYRDGIGCVNLFFYAWFFERKHWPKMSLEVAALILSMACVGVYLQQTLFLFGLQFTNVIFASLMMNCIPGWAYLIAAIFRLEEISFRRRDGQAKMLGILFCVTGATILTLFKGPAIFGYSSPLPPLPGVPLGALFSVLLGWTIDRWRLGAICLLSTSICSGAFVNLQVPALKRFPAPFTLMSLTTLLGTFIFATTAFLRGKGASDFVLPSGADIIAAIYAGLVASGSCLFLACWSNKKSGPILVAAYAPMQPIFATFFGVLFLGDALFSWKGERGHSVEEIEFDEFQVEGLDCLFGAISILSGLFLVIWGTREGLRLKSLSLQIPTHGDYNVDSAKPTSPLVEPLLS